MKPHPDKDTGGTIQQGVEVLGSSLMNQVTIDLTGDSDDSCMEVEEVAGPAQTGAAGSAAKSQAAASDAVAVKSQAMGKRKVAWEPTAAAVDDDDDDEVQVVEPPPPDASAAGSSSMAVDEANEGDEDDEVTFCWRKGDLALADFPHCRENCLNKRFVKGKESDACGNCYCYVCDAPVKDCPKWESHCKATHTSPQWRDERQRWRSGGAAAAAPAAVPPADSPGAAARPQQHRRQVDRWSCDKLLAAVQQVFPEEAPPPAGFPSEFSLKPYQRQSLAFMLGVERSTDAALVGSSGFRGGRLCDEIGSASLRRPAT